MMEQSQPIQTIKAGLQLSFRRLWVSIILAFIMLETAVMSLEQAHWFENQPSFTLILMISFITGYIIHKRLWNRWLKWGLITGIGLFLSFWQVWINLPVSLLPWYERLGDIIASSFRVITMSASAENSVHFALFLLLITWFLGQTAVWLLLKRHNAWITALVGLGVILLNLSNLPARYYGFLFVYLVFAVVFIGQVRIALETGVLAPGSFFTRQRSMRLFLVSLIVVGLLASTGAWILKGTNPINTGSVNPESTPVLKNIQGFFENFLSVIPSKQTVIVADDQGDLDFERNYERFGDDVHFIIDAESAHYWRTWTYDIYTSDGWTNSRAEHYTTGNEMTAIGTAERERITLNVESNIKTDILVTTGETLSTDPKADWYALAPRSSSNPQFYTDTAIALITPVSLQPGSQFTVTAAVTTASAASLDSAGEDYPEWITNYYLQLPDTLPEIVREMSANITAGATTPYEKAILISENLTYCTYNLRTNPPPDEIDAVEYFLFEKKAGACADFASAMTILLRASGVPARLSTGYSPGERDPESGRFLVKENDRHAWTEVYFPGYGWIEFEATPSSQVTRGIVGVQAVRDDGTTTDWVPDIHVEPFLNPDPVYESPFNSPGSSTGDTASTVLLLWPFLLLGAGIIVAIIIYFVYFRSGMAKREAPITNSDYATEAYAGMCSLAREIGLGPKPSQTPLEYGQMLKAQFPGDSPSIDMILDAFVNRRYGGNESMSETIKWKLIDARRNIFEAIRNRIEGRE